MEQARTARDTAVLGGQPAYQKWTKFQEEEAMPPEADSPETASILEPGIGRLASLQLSPQRSWDSEPSVPPLSPTSSTTLDDCESLGDMPPHEIAVCLPSSTLVNPRSHFAGFLPPSLPVSESAALRRLVASVPQPELDEDDFIDFELVEFSIYVRSTYYPSELRPLQHLATKQSHDTFYFDGVLRGGGTEHYVQRVPFNELPIGNYGTAHASVGDQIWIRSWANRKKEIYYRLGKPTLEYARFHTPFLWLVDFAKHVVDFCSSKAVVALWHFKQDFGDWLVDQHGASPSFQRWRAQFPGRDLRSAVVANVEFIWKEVVGVLGPATADSLPVFKEAKHFSQYPPSAPLPDKNNTIPPTIVTPYIYDNFGHMRLGKLLQPIQSEPLNPPQPREPTKPPEPEAREPTPEEEDVIIVQSDVIAPRRPRNSSAPVDKSNAYAGDVHPGDVISTHPDGEETGTSWRQEAGLHDDRWFGLVQKVHKSKTGRRSFDVTWLYRPADTPCCRMRYPWGRELFLSDHCTCLEGAGARWTEDEVLGKHSVDWFGTPETSTAELFVRQTYMVEGRRWVSLEREHMRCNHFKDPPIPYRPGDTVLAVIAGAEFSEPFEVVGSSRSLLVELRPLPRRRDVEDAKNESCPPNELVYSHAASPITTRVGNITGKCLVRVFCAGEPLLTPYDRGGTANAFFITHKLEVVDGDKVLVPFEPDEARTLPMRQGFDPSRSPPQKLRGLDLFCGSGNFGRGLEEGGVVEMRCANDVWDRAMHTYMANTRDGDTRPFLGSVDDFVRQHLEGEASDQYDFVAGGSPCPGFSMLTIDRTSDAQLKNQSFVASFASCVDHFRPRYGILENVPSIVQLGKAREEDVFSQLICALVGLGYQIQVVLGDAWSYGAPQNRTRAFLYFAAPGQRLPDPPLPSHSHHAAVRGRALGVMSNGEPYVRRPFAATAFKFVSAAEGTTDLPEIYDAKPDCCVPFPDHRIQTGVTATLRAQFSVIPTRPHGMSYATAWNEGQGVMTRAERDMFPKGTPRVAPKSKGWGRVGPGDVFSTMTTRCGPTDARTGRLLHWTEPRPLTILEARRAQGIPDDEVLLGTPTDQWKLVGNSVSRHVALALGVQFREAVLGSLWEDEGEDGVLAQRVLPGSRSTPEDVASSGRASRDATDSSTFSRRGSQSTPPTSGSESTEGQRKRTLSQALAEKMRPAKVRKREYLGNI